MIGLYWELMEKSISHVIVIGAGLAGSECAYQLAKRGLSVALIEMRPKKTTPAHQTDRAAEMVCSNSLRSNDVFNAVGLLKHEMSALDSLIIRAAYKSRVPAGSALAVDRDSFSACVTAALESMPAICRIADEVTAITHAKDGLMITTAASGTFKGRHCVIATGPLTSQSLARWILEHTRQEHLYFYDSIAPIVEADSIDTRLAFKAARYDKGDDADGDYFNCPMTAEQYYQFITAIGQAQLVEVHDFDQARFFEGCLPIEEMVRRGHDTLRFGPMKAVGLRAPDWFKGRLYAVVQLRQDNLHGSLYNMVGFQTRMKWPEQKRIFRMVPGLENAAFVRMGAMHRNTYICSPTLLDNGMELKTLSGVHFAGQITGCEGYVESAAIGLFVGLHLARLLIQKPLLQAPPQTTALGALIHHILHADPDHYQPMNINFGLLAPLEETDSRKFEKRSQWVRRAVADFQKWRFDSDL